MLLLAGCAQQALDGEINAATIRVLTRHGCEVVIAEGAGCCGALPLHMGREEEGRALAANNAAAWSRVRDVDAVVVNASGCGTTVKDYGHLLGDEQGKRIGAMTRDITEILETLDLKVRNEKFHRVAYHDACSLQHGQRVMEPPRESADQGGIRGRRSAGEAFLLRFGRHLQSVAAGDRGSARPAQGIACGKPRSGFHRRRQSRLHGADRPLHAIAGAAHGVADRLGDRRAAAGGLARPNAARAAAETEGDGSDGGFAVRRFRILVNEEGNNMSTMDTFFAEVETALGSGSVNRSEETIRRYGENTMAGGDKRPAGVVYPSSTAQVQAVVKLANKLKVPLYPVSTGQNIGLGSRSAPREGQVVVDLGFRMNRILEIDEKLAFAVVEPGVVLPESL